MGEQRNILCIADGSHECRTAVLFGAERAMRNGSALVIMCVINSEDNSLVSALGAGVLEELRLEALDNLQELSQIVKQRTGIVPQLLIKEGEIHQALRECINEDAAIKTLLLAAASSKKGPGPLVVEATRGTMALGVRPIAIMIVPEELSDSEISELAS